MPIHLVQSPQGDPVKLEDHEVDWILCFPVKVKDHEVD